MESIVYYDKGTKEYPERMMPFSDMPEGIYVKGRLPRDDRPSAAIVGGRVCSAYGREQARRFAREMAASGVQIISGLASGIDAAAHEGALEGGGTTFAVLGCGVNICYPRENYPLMRKILGQKGGVLSEFPPGERPLAWHFPQRNRLISALADLVLVVEARKKSGSLITADFALEQGKSVYALPGRVNDSLSEGSNRLIAQGAGIAVEPSVLLEELGISVRSSLSETTGEPGNSAKHRTDRMFTEEERRILQALENGSRTLEELHQISRCPIPQLSSLLVRLQLDGVIQEEGKNTYYLRG